MTEQSMVERVGESVLNQLDLRNLDDETREEIKRSVGIAAIEAMREHKLVYRDEGHVVHEIRGAPNDVWKAMIDAALDEKE